MLRVLPAQVEEGNEAGRGLLVLPVDIAKVGSQFAFFIDGAKPEVKRCTTIKNALADGDYRIEPEQDEAECVEGVADESVGAFARELWFWHTALRTTQMPECLANAEKTPNIGDPK